MKKLLVIVVLGLLWCNVGFADDRPTFSKAIKEAALSVDKRPIHS